MTAAVKRFADARLNTIRDAQESLAYLAEQTGGFAVVNTNDLAGGLRRITADVRDYYVLGYEPDPSTFVGEGQRPQQHTITVKARRAGLRVRSRRALVGVSDPKLRTTAPTPAESLVRAAMSPFTDGTIELRATTLAGYSPQHGTFVRTVLHLDTVGCTARVPVRHHTGVCVRDLQRGSQGRTGHHALAGRRAADVESARSLGEPQAARASQQRAA
jgi:hypothetical protein